MIRALPVVLVAPLAFALAACGGSSPPGETPAGPAASAVPAPSASAEAPPPSAAPSAAPAPSAAASAAPAADPPALSADDKARSDYAIAFVTAVAKRDQAALGRLTAAEDFCKVVAAAKKTPAASIAACVKEMKDATKMGLEVYTKAVPTTFEPGAAEVMPIAADKGIYMVLVRTKGFDPKGPDADKNGVAVTLAEAEGKRFVVFPQKKKETAAKKK